MSLDKQGGFLVWLLMSWRDKGQGNFEEISIPCIPCVFDFGMSTHGVVNQ